MKLTEILKEYDPPNNLRIKRQVWGEYYVNVHQHLLLDSKGSSAWLSAVDVNADDWIMVKEPLLSSLANLLLKHETTRLPIFKRAGWNSPHENAAAIDEEGDLLLMKDGVVTDDPFRMTVMDIMADDWFYAGKHRTRTG